MALNLSSQTGPGGRPLLRLKIAAPASASTVTTPEAPAAQRPQPARPQAVRPDPLAVLREIARREAPPIEAPVATPVADPAQPSRTSIKRQRRDARRRATAWLWQTWPKLFDLSMKPIAVGLGAEIVEHAEAAGLDAVDIRRALHRHVHSRPYLQALARERSMRHGLDGEAVAPVTEEHRHAAREALRTLNREK